MGIRGESWGFVGNHGESCVIMGNHGDNERRLLPGWGGLRYLLFSRADSRAAGIIAATPEFASLHRSFLLQPLDHWFSA